MSFSSRLARLDKAQGAKKGLSPTGPQATDDEADRASEPADTADCTAPWAAATPLDTLDMASSPTRVAFATSLARRSPSLLAGSKAGRRAKSQLGSRDATLVPRLDTVVVVVARRLPPALALRSPVEAVSWARDWLGRRVRERLKPWLERPVRV
jgi:hypothetical protein